jgi:chromosome segregation ATPase
MTTVVRETIVTEYKQFNIESFGTDLTTKLDGEIKTLSDSRQANTDESNQKVDRYAGLHNDHKALQHENTEAHEARKAVLGAINDDNNDYAHFAKEAAGEHSKLRDDITSKEHPLRILQNEVQLLHLDNKNLQQVIDTEAALRDAKAQAELSAVTTVNTDLSELTKRLEKNISEENEKKNDAEKILKELQGKIHFCCFS